MARQLVLCWLACTAPAAMAAVISAASLCPAGTAEAAATNFVANADFANLAASPGNGNGVTLDPPNNHPFNNAVSLVTGIHTDPAGAPPLYQTPFPGDPPRVVAASTNWLIANGNTLGAGNGIWWSQAVTGLTAGRSYTFVVYASSPLNGAQANRPSLSLRVMQAAAQNIAIGLVPNDTAATDNWSLFQAVFTATQTTATLAITNLVAAAGERNGWFALAQPTLRQCAARVNLAISKSNGAAAVVSGTTTTYVITVSNAGPAAADGSVLTDAPGAGLSCTQVSCAASGAASCPAAGAGAGQLSTANLISPAAGVTLGSLPADSTLTFQLSCFVTATGT